MPFIHPKIRALLQAFKWTKNWVTGSTRSRTGGTGTGTGTGGLNKNNRSVTKSQLIPGGAIELQDRQPAGAGDKHFRKSSRRAQVSEKSLGSSSRSGWDSDEQIILPHHGAAMTSTSARGPAEADGPPAAGHGGGGIAIRKEITVQESSLADGMDWGHNIAVGQGQSQRR